MAYIHRETESLILEMVGQFPAILVTGCRQSGKSTLLQYLATQSGQHIKEVSLDDLNERRMASEDPELFLRSHETPLIIDEFQYAPSLLSYIKIKIDEARKNELFGDKKPTGTLYYLTGSQVFETMEDVSESLAGRVGIVDLYPLSAREIEDCTESLFIPDIDSVKARKPTRSESIEKLYGRIFRGSYPQLQVNRKISEEAFYSAYLRTYIERDVRKILEIQDEPKFLRFITCMAARTGQEFNASDIAKDVGASPDTIKKWAGVLANTYIIFMLSPHMNNNIGRIVKRPKFYFMDTGLAAFLTGYVSSKTLERSAYSGAIFETYIISEIVKSFAAHGIDPKKHLYYYRDNNGREIDLLVMYEDKVYPVEIKKSANPKRDAIKSFDVVKRFEMDCPNGIVLCLSGNIHTIDEKNYMVPIEYI